MPRISSFKIDERTTQVSMGDDEPLSITYRPNTISTTFHDEVVDIAEKNRVGAAIVKMLAASLVRWDLLDNEGQPYPTTEAALRELPLAILIAVNDAIQEDLSPKKKKSPA